MAAIEGKWYASIGTHAGDAYPQSDDTVRFVYADQPDGTKYIVAKVWADDAGDYESTARLVAAAPALLALVKRLREVFEELDDDWRVMDATRVDELISSDGLYACDQAIAKAEGRG